MKAFSPSIILALSLMLLSTLRADEPATANPAITPAIVTTAGQPPWENLTGTDDLQRKLSKIIIPDVEFRATPTHDALKFLRDQALRLDPDSGDLLQILKLPPLAADVLGSVVPTVTLTLRNIPLLEALRYTARQAGLILQLEPNAIALVPIADWTDPLYTAEYRVPPNYVPGPDAFRRDAQPFLLASGVVFPPGASATYLPGPSKLIVRNTENELLLLCVLTDPAVPPADNKDEAYRIECNARWATSRRIMIPEADFSATRLSDAVEFLRQEAHRCHPAANPDLRWVNIDLKLPVSDPKPAEPRVNLHKKDASLQEILGDLAAQTGLEFATEPYALSLLPPEEARKVVPLVGADYRVRPTLADALGALPPFGPGGVGVDARPWLKEKGVALPEGARAVYFPANHRLIAFGMEEFTSQVSETLACFPNARP